MLEIEYQFREQDLILFNEERYKNSEQYRNDVKMNRVLVPCVIWLISAFYYFYYKDLNSFIYLVVIGAMWSYLVPKTTMSRWKHKLLNSYTEKEKAAMFGNYKLSIDPTDAKFLHEKSPSGNNKMAFADLVRVEYGKGYVGIYIDLDTALVVPVETVTKGNLEQFAEQIDKMIDRYS